LLLRSFQEGVPLLERVVWKAELENEDLSSVSRKLSTIAQSNVDRIEELGKKVQIANEVWQSLLDEPGDLVKGLIPMVKSTIVQSHPGYEFDDAEIEDLLKERIKGMFSAQRESLGSQIVEEVQSEPPRRMKLSGDTFELRNSYEILVNTANWLIKKGKLKSSDCPVPAGPKRNLVNTEPKHKYGDPFLQMRKLSNGLVIETHYSTASCIRYSRMLLERFGFSPDTLVTS
jgi:hypothetical protein